jgi:hypothetical protein
MIYTEGSLHQAQRCGFVDKHWPTSRWFRFRSAVQLARMPACHAGVREVQALSLPLNSARFVTISGRRMELVESTCFVFVHEWPHATAQSSQQK